MSTLRVNAIQDVAGTGQPQMFGTAKAWVNFNGTGTVAIRQSFNVSSITDNGTGDYAVNLTTALSDINYSPVGTQGTRTTTFTGGFGVEAQPSTSSACVVRTYTGGAIADFANLYVAIFR